VGLAPLDPPVAGLARRQGSHQAGTKVLWVIPHRGEDWGRGVDVWLLKPFKGEPPTKTSVLPPVHHGRACAEPEAVLRGRMARGCRELLMQWKGLPMADVTWTDWEELRPQVVATPASRGCDDLRPDSGCAERRSADARLRRATGSCGHASR
jgi:hypothetical protein